MNDTPETIITVGSGFISYKGEDAPFIIKIDAIQKMQYIDHVKKVQVIVSDELEFVFLCPLQEFEKLMDDIIKSKDKE